MTHPCALYLPKGLQCSEAEEDSAQALIGLPNGQRLSSRGWRHVGLDYSSTPPTILALGLVSSTADPFVDGVGRRRNS